MNNRKDVIRVLAVLVATQFGVAGSARAGLLGTAQDYNLFILQNASESNTDSQGRVAVGGTATFSNYSAASSFTNTYNAMVVGGAVNYNGGTVYGDLHYGTTKSLTAVTVNGTTTNDQPVNFASATSYLTGISTTLSQLKANGTVSTETSGPTAIALTGTSTTQNVFNLTAAQLASANNFGLDVRTPTGSLTIINVAGTSPNLMNFQMYVNGSTSETNAHINDILFNFVNATTLTDNNVAILGSVLAPLAALNMGFTHVDGTLIGQSLTGNVEVHNYPFTNQGISSVPEPGSFTLLSSLSVVGLVGAWVKRGRPSLWRALKGLRAG